MMELTTENGITIQDPSGDDLRKALATLGQSDDSFAILAASEQNYIQVAGSKESGYLAEYREGSEETHHASTADDLSHQQVVKLLTAYANGGSWKSMIAWQQGFDIKRPAKRASRKRAQKSAPEGNKLLITFFLVGVISIVACAYFALRTHQFLARAVEVPGKVEHLDGNGNGQGPVVSYVDLEGRRLSFKFTPSDGSPYFHEEQGVMVLYDPNDPQFPPDARIEMFAQLWGLSMGAFIAGVVFCGIPLIYWLTIPRRRA